MFAHIDGAFQTDSGLPQPVCMIKAVSFIKISNVGTWSVTEKYFIIRRRKKEWLSKKFISYIIPTQM